MQQQQEPQTAAAAAASTGFNNLTDAAMNEAMIARILTMKSSALRDKIRADELLANTERALMTGIVVGVGRADADAQNTSATTKATNTSSGPQRRVRWVSPVTDAASTNNKNKNNDNKENACAAAAAVDGPKPPENTAACTSSSSNCLDLLLPEQLVLNLKPPPTPSSSASTHGNGPKRAVSPDADSLFRLMSLQFEPKQQRRNKNDSDLNPVLLHRNRLINMASDDGDEEQEQLQPQHRHQQSGPVLEVVDDDDDEA